jgi:hypothetical protein
MKNKQLLKRVSLIAMLFTSLAFTSKITAQYVPMTFHNGSMKSIFLEIPGVMNPNLNPMSDSGVSLKIGQKVFFYPKGKKDKKELLFTVNSTFKKDTVLQIDEIIKARKIELKVND